MARFASNRLPHATAGGEGNQEEIAVTWKWVLLVAPAIGGLLVGFLHKLYTADTIDASDGYINFFHRRRALMDIRKKPGGF
ncbi:MAG: hypothetical protein ACP5QG_08545 [candidate division WOR-3 bacterium]